MQAVREAAAQTQKTCQMLLHHDADEYVECIDKLLLQVKPATPRYLGIAYFGWVGALNSARISLPGSDDVTEKKTLKSVGRDRQRQGKHVKVAPQLSELPDEHNQVCAPFDRNQPRSSRRQNPC
ncbi:MAG: hypothetical protein H7255_01845 [Ramlibacter sp.]|nr:hypothetical protein [Ramlibacter sp.]